MVSFASFENEFKVTTQYQYRQVFCFFLPCIHPQVTLKTTLTCLTPPSQFLFLETGGSGAVEGDDTSVPEQWRPCPDLDEEKRGWNQVARKMAGISWLGWLLGTPFYPPESFSFQHKLAVENEQTVLRVCYVNFVNFNTSACPAVSSVRMSLTQNLQLTACTCETSGSVLVFRWWSVNVKMNVL